MLDLSYQVVKAEPLPHAAAPHLVFRLRVTCDDRGTAAPPLIQSVALRCQLRIEAARRPYTGAEQERLGDLFGEPQRWGQTLQPMLWTHAGLTVPSFTGSTEVDMPVPCTFDFNVGATKYFDALEGGEVPLCLLFSGTIFYAGPDGRLQIAQVPWEKEANFRLPVKVWKEMMDLYYPNSAWLCLRKDVFDRLNQLKSRLALPSWEQALETLLDARGERRGP